MTERRTHYLYYGVARCGNPMTNWTITPERVTCLSCQRLMKGEVK